MKKIILIFSLLFNVSILFTYAQIEGLYVETYYVSDANDATDTLGGGLPEGSVTYRIFLDLASKSRLKAIYGSKNRALSITSTEVFFNNLLRGRTFGYEINRNNLDNNTIALDSWLSMGFASNKHFGVLKSNDPDTSIVGGINSDGGSASIEGGILANSNPLAGLPLIVSDGLVLTDSSVAGFFDYGILTQFGDDSTIFGSLVPRTSFYSEDARLINNLGISGFEPNNHILIAQLTTKGTLSFSLNIEIEKEDGSIVNYVSDNAPAGVDTFYSSWLSYPFECGCTDPNFLEYRNYFACDDGSCATQIVFGCMDPLACNFDPAANRNLTELCCYNSQCALNLNVVCPGTVYGCTDPNALNYNPKATITSSLDTCCYVAGCLDSRYLEYNPDACYDNGTYCKVIRIKGCMDKSACNYNPFANDSIGAECFQGCSSIKDAPYAPALEIAGSIENLQYKFYPNPANDLIHFSIYNPLASETKVELLDIFGRTMISRSFGNRAGFVEELVDVSTLHRGLYFIRIHAAGEIFVETLTINE